MKPSFFGTSEERCAFIFGQAMKPCPKCGSYDLKFQTPIRLDEPIPEDADPKKLLGIWARATRAGNTPLQGTSYLICWACKHRGPSVDVSGRTSEDVGSDPVVASEIKRLWNEQ